MLAIVAAFGLSVFREKEKNWKPLSCLVLNKQKTANEKSQATRYDEKQKWLKKVFHS